MQVESRPSPAIFLLILLLLSDLGHSAFQNSIYAKGHVGEGIRSHVGQLVVHYYDLYGRFHYDGRGVKVYDSHSSWSGFPYDTRGPSKYYSGDAYRNHADTSNRKIEPPDYVGSARLNLLGRDAEFVCQFPPHFNIVSNIVWQKDTGYVQDGSRFRAVQLTSNESVLRIHDYDIRDDGYYRCLATEEYPSPGRYEPGLRTVYKDMIFSAYSV